MERHAEYFFTGSVAAGVVRLQPEAERWRGTHLTGIGGPIVGVPRRPMLFSWLGAREDVVGSSAVALYSNRDQEYRKAPLTERGEETDWVWLRPDWTAQIVAERDPRGALDEDRVYARMHAPAPTPALLRLRRLTRVLDRVGDPDPIVLEEAAIETVRELVAAAHGLPAPTRARRTQTRRAHADAVNDAAELIATRFSERLTLDEVAREVCMAPLHFCRLFRERTGMTIHTYLSRVRLAEAMERLVDPSRTIAGIALECGFASGSHLSDAMSRHAGCRPNVARGRLAELA